MDILSKTIRARNLFSSSTLSLLAGFVKKFTMNKMIPSLSLKITTLIIKDSSKEKNYLKNKVLIITNYIAKKEMKNSYQSCKRILIFP